ncbi:MAG: thiamine-phosphate kinase [Acidiferrobacterales bacterium]
MSLNEFEVIKRFFDHRGQTAPGVILGIGDDAAIVRTEPGQDIVIAADVLNAGIHFPESTDARAIGHKALAVNLSDLAAMGAKPSWFTLSLSLPKVDEDWLTGFSTGLFELAEQFGIFLVGGDTVRGPLSISVQVVGQVAEGSGLRRSGAQVGDKIYVSGTLGDAALALKQVQQGEQPEPELRNRLDYPVPRVDLGTRLLGIASSCIDISDGLAADLGHILEASGCGAIVSTAALPVSEYLNALDSDSVIRLALTGGDDFELCFTVSAEKSKLVEQLGRELDLPITCIGEITDKSGLQLSDYSNSLDSTGFNHFAREA